MTHWSSQITPKGQSTWEGAETSSDLTYAWQLWGNCNSNNNCVITAQVHNNAYKNIWDVCFPSFCSFAFFSETTMTARQQCRPWQNEPSFSIPQKCHQTDNICASSPSVGHMTQSLHALQSVQLSATSVIHGYKVFSVLLKPIVSEDILYDSHHLHSPLSPKIPLAHTHTILLCQNLLRLGTGEF